MDEIVIEGKHYLSSRRAAEMIGYSQDYVTHLAREGILDARMVEGLWFISRTALDVHKTMATTKAEEKAEVNHEEHSHGPATLVSFDGREYVSTARAANAAGFTPDYIAQLAREGTVPGRQVGNRWYVDLESVLAYKNGEEIVMKEKEESVQESRHYVYEKDESDLMPKTKHHKEERVEDVEKAHQHKHEEEAAEDLEAEEINVPIHVYGDAESDEAESETAPAVRQHTVSEEKSAEKEVRIPIRIEEEAPSREAVRMTHAVSTPPIAHQRAVPSRPRVTPRRQKSGISWATVGAGAALTLVVVFSLGITSLKSSATYTERPKNAKEAFAASVNVAFKRIGDIIEEKLVPELHYIRTQK